MKKKEIESLVGLDINEASKVVLEAGLTPQVRTEAEGKTEVDENTVLLVYDENGKVLSAETA